MPSQTQTQGKARKHFSSRVLANKTMSKRTVDVYKRHFLFISERQHGHVTNTTVQISVPTTLACPQHVDGDGGIEHECEENIGDGKYVCDLKLVAELYNNMTKVFENGV